MKKVLLIAGGGTLGAYTASELLRLGHCVDIICLEDKISDNDNLKYIKAEVNEQYLKVFLDSKYYDGIINFIHYDTVESYEPTHKLLVEHTDHLIFLSSYRIYANENPVTEETPMLLDVIKDDQEFIDTERYALSKARVEKFLQSNEYKRNVTIVRPVISFSEHRFDLVITTHQSIIQAAKSYEILKLPLKAKYLTAGLDWAGNSGKLIANLIFKENTKGQAYTISSGQNLTWGDVAKIYSELTGCQFEWEELSYPDNWYHWKYDRAFNRVIDCNKVLKATGLTKADFKSIKDGLKIELEKINFKKR